MAKIYLIRHCESEGNACRRAQAQTDALVTRKGFEQNEMLRRRFLGTRIDAIYSSDAYRAVMTVEPIAKERGLTVNVRLSLRELTTGIWEDGAWGNIAKDFPKEYEAFTKTPWTAKVPGATSYGQTAERMVYCLKKIAKEVGDGTALVVSHSCSIKSTLCMLAGKPMDEVLTFGHGDNTSVSLLEADEDGNFSIVYTHDNSHLPERLRRAWGGVAGSDINMVILPCKTAEQQEDLIALIKENDLENGRAAFADDHIRKIFAKRAKEPNAVSISYLKGKPTGYVILGEDAMIPKDTGIIQEYYVIPELQEKGYSEQLFGYAAHEMRYSGKTRLAMKKSVTKEEQRAFDRFTFHEMNGHCEYEELELFSPHIPYPVLA